ncbi:MAG: ferredoxin family protein [Chloroflexota bacterium]
MIYQIDWEGCNGCGVCSDICPMDVFIMDEATQKAVIRYPEECMTCFECERECDTGAIEVSPFRVPTPLVINCAEGGD